MGQAVQPRAGEERVAEEVRPLGRRAVAGEDDAPALVALVDDVVQVDGPLWREGFEAEVVDAEQGRLDVAGEAALVTAVGPAGVAVGQELVRRAEEDVEALAGRLVGAGLGEVALSLVMRVPS